MALYTSSVLMARTQVPSHTMVARPRYNIQITLLNACLDLLHGIRQNVY